MDHPKETSTLNLNTASMTVIARAIAAGQVTCVEVVTHFVNEQKKWNPKINAVVEERWHDALAEAESKDLWRKENPQATLPPLFGIPITIKEMISVQGYRNTLGSIHRRNLVQPKDATVVSRLRQAGAIILGTTNVPELGFWFECENPVYGRTNNPFDLTRTAGGSSGGEGAIVAAGGSALGIGSDVGGSIRMPAGFCGLFGHNPSGRIIPITGHFPATFEDMPAMKDPRYPLTVIGPLARSADDIWAVMNLLIGPDEWDPEVKKDFKLQNPITDWSDATVWLLPSPRMQGVGTTEPAMSEAVEIAGTYFESLGAHVRKMKPDALKEAALLWSTAVNEVEGRTFEEALFNKKPYNITLETIRTLALDVLHPKQLGTLQMATGLLNDWLGKPQFTFPSLMTVVAERLMNKSTAKEKVPSQENESSPESSTEELRLRAELKDLRMKMNVLLTGKNILILPVHPRPAPLHRSTWLRPFDFAMTGIFNALKLPVTTAPITWTNDLPHSVQVVSAWGQDHVTISAAQTLEQAFGTSRRPPPLHS